MLDLSEITEEGFWEVFRYGLTKKTADGAPTHVKVEGEEDPRKMTAGELTVASIAHRDERWKRLTGKLPLSGVRESHIDPVVRKARTLAAGKCRDLGKKLGKGHALLKADTFEAIAKAVKAEGVAIDVAKLKAHAKKLVTMETKTDF